MLTHRKWGHVSEKKLSIWGKLQKQLKQRWTKVTENSKQEYYEDHQC